MGFVPYSRQHIDAADRAAVDEVLRSEFLTQGPAVPAFERAFADRHAAPHAVAVSNATAALHIGCLALGIGPGSRVWTSPNSFVASANCARYCGADVDFVDIDPQTRNLSTAELERKLAAAASAGKLPHAVIPVDFAGQPCDLAEMRELADRFGFRILEDASHATGASYRGQPIGSAYADITVFSFHPVKIVTSGEGGMLVTRDAALAERLRQLRSHGIVRDPAALETLDVGPWYYEQQLLGFNYRLTDLQAALGRSQLARLEAMHSRRRELAARYDELLERLPLRLPKVLPDRVSAWHLYVVEIDLADRRQARRAVFDHMRKAGIGVNVHYIPIHTQPYYRALGFRSGDFPSAERYYDGALTIPLYPELRDHEQQRVVEELGNALRGR